MDYFCVDVEASGPTPGLHNLLSIGITHVRRFEGKYQPFEDWYIELKPVYDGFLPAAMAVNGLDPDRLRAQGKDPKDALHECMAWIQSVQKDPKERPIFVAHNAPFDWMFFQFYCGTFAVTNPFGHSALDTKALAMGRLSLPWNQTSMKTIVALLKNIPPFDTRMRHHAGADARHLAYVFSSLMNLPRQTIQPG